MDKLNYYRAIIKTVVTEIAKMIPSDKNSETQLITDVEGGYYVLFSIGWQGIMREYLPFVHIDIKLIEKYGFNTMVQI